MARWTTNPVPLDELYRFYVDAHETPSTRCVPMTEAEWNVCIVQANHSVSVTVVTPLVPSLVQRAGNPPRLACPSAPVTQFA
jgi:hypothetical protein